MNSVVVKLVGFSSEVDAVLSESVVDFSELAPVSSLPSSGQVLIGNDTDVDLLDWELELTHKHVDAGLVDGLLLSLVNSDEREADALDVQIVDHRVSEEVVGIQNDRLDSREVKSTVGVDGEVLILVPGVPDSEAAGQVVSAVSVKNEVGAWDVSASDFND